MASLDLFRTVGDRLRAKGLAGLASDQMQINAEEEERKREAAKRAQMEAVRRKFEELTSDAASFGQGAVEGLGQGFSDLGTAARGAVDQGVQVGQPSSLQQAFTRVTGPIQERYAAGQEEADAFRQRQLDQGVPWQAQRDVDKPSAFTSASTGLRGTSQQMIEDAEAAEAVSRVPGTAARQRLVGGAGRGVANILEQTGAQSDRLARALPRSAGGLREADEGIDLGEAARASLEAGLGAQPSAFAEAATHGGLMEAGAPEPIANIAGITAGALAPASVVDDLALALGKVGMRVARPVLENAVKTMGARRVAQMLRQGPDAIVGAFERIASDYADFPGVAEGNLSLVPEGAPLGEARSTREAARPLAEIGERAGRAGQATSDFGAGINRAVRGALPQPGGRPLPRLEPPSLPEGLPKPPEPPPLPPLPGLPGANAAEDATPEVGEALGLTTAQQQPDKRGLIRAALDWTKLGMLLSLRGVLRQGAGVGALAYQPVERLGAATLALPERGVRTLVGKSTADLPKLGEAPAMVTSLWRTGAPARTEAWNTLRGRPTEVGEQAVEALRGPSKGGNQATGFEDAGWRLVGSFDAFTRKMAAEAERAAVRYRGGTEAEAEAAAQAAGAYRTLQQPLTTREAARAAADAAGKAGKEASGGTDAGEAAAKTARDPAALLDEFASAVDKVSKTEIGQGVLPFWRIPYNGMKYDLERSPLGLVSAAASTGKALAGKSTVAPTELYERWMRAITGSALAYGLYKQAEQGNVTGPAPTNPTELAAWRAEGKQPFSVKVGGVWRPVTLVPGMNASLTAAASMADFARRRQERSQPLDGSAWMDAAAHLINTTTAYVATKPFFDQMYETLGDVMRPKEDEPLTSGLTGVAQDIALGRITPGLLRDWRRAIDATERAPRDPLEAAMTYLPGVSGSVPARRDTYGRVVTKEGEGLERLVNPVVGRTARSSPRRYTNSKDALQDTEAAAAIAAVDAYDKLRREGKPVGRDEAPTERQRRLADYFRGQKNPDWERWRAEEKERLRVEKAQGGALERIKRGQGADLIREALAGGSGGRR